MVMDEIFPTDAKFLVDFIKCIEDHISQKGINLRNRVKLTLKYYYESDRNMTADSTKDKQELIHGIEELLFELDSLYKEKREFRGVLLCCILHNCVAKLSGSKNPHYDNSDFNFSIPLFENENNKLYYFFDGDLGLISLQPNFYQSHN